VLTRHAALAGILLSVLTACATPPEPAPPPPNTLTHGNVQLNLKAGETTQAAVLEAFGAPNVTTIDASGQEVWTYQRHATVSQRSSNRNYWTVVLLGGSANADGFEQTQRTMTLIVRFDANKIVSDFRSRAAEF
jgi:outer membrane protein assembly factor BamE (lipoprotein component of BamABCDE complex)